MQLETKADLRLVGRAIRSGWDVPKEVVKSALLEVIATKDPELMIEAAKLLILADTVDVKREELELKQQAKDNEQRLRLLELAKSIPVGELAALASQNGIVSHVDGGREDKGQGTQTKG